MDRFTIRNLELYQSPNAGAVTLLDVIDKTSSPMGARLLKRWLALPLKDKTEIQKRHDIVQSLAEMPDELDAFRTQLKQIADLERLVSKIATGKVSPRELVQLKNSLDAVVRVKTTARDSGNESLQDLGNRIDECELLREKIAETIQAEAPVALSKGNVIASGINTELDELREISTSGKKILDRIEKEESERTGIISLKIAFNNVFGYYIEVRNAHKEKVPENWIRKQTLVNAERYITEELKEYEAKILGAEEKIQKLECDIYEKLVMWIGGYIRAVQQNAQLLARLDCLC